MTGRVADKAMIWADVGSDATAAGLFFSQHPRPHKWSLAQWNIAEPVRSLFPQYTPQSTRPFVAYKNKGGLKQDDLRRRREEQQVEIRRQKREENIAKRRNFLPTSTPDSDEEATSRDWEPPVRLPYPSRRIFH